MQRKYLLQVSLQRVLVTHVNPKEPDVDEEILEKIDRLVSEEIKVVHVGACRLDREKKECPRIAKICEMIESRGIQVVRGTHRES